MRHLHLRAFPDAEDQAHTRRGSQAEILVITTLEDDEEEFPAMKGSLRRAIEAKLSRVRVFNLSGTVPGALLVWRTCWSSGFARRWMLRRDGATLVALVSGGALGWH